MNRDKTMKHLFTLLLILLPTASAVAQGTLSIPYTYDARQENGLRWTHLNELSRLTALNQQIAVTNGTPLPLPNLGQFTMATASNAVAATFVSYAVQAEAAAAAGLAQRTKYAELMQLLRVADDAKRDSILDAAITEARR